LLIPVKIYNFEQSAGNQQTLLKNNVLVGTSETKRGPHNLLWEDIVRVIKISLIYLNIYNFSNTQSYFNNFDLDETINKLKPIKVYNLKEDRIHILKEENLLEKSGVYCLLNNINGHTYVGSSINLASSLPS
jgi:hypothetical protein